jgi:hypothetical protein
MMLQVPSVWHHPQGMRLRGLGQDGDTVSGDGDDNTSGGDFAGATAGQGTSGDAFGGSVANAGTGGSVSPGDYCPANYTYNVAGSCIANSGSASGGVASSACPSGYAQSGSLCVPTSGGGATLPVNSVSSFLSTLANDTPKIVGAITGSPATAAACASAGGTWNQNTLTCAGGLGSYVPLLLLAAGVGLVFMFVGGKH